ncbi:hypothetical protein ACFE04_019468 [Oxalis oulophora]
MNFYGVTTSTYADSKAAPIPQSPAAESTPPSEFWGQSDLWYCLFYGVPQDPMIGAILHFELSTFPFVLGFRVSGFLLLSELNRDRLYFPGLALPTSMPIDTEPGPTLKESATSFPVEVAVSKNGSVRSQIPPSSRRIPWQDIAGKEIKSVENKNTELSKTHTRALSPFTRKKGRPLLPRNERPSIPKPLNEHVSPGLFPTDLQYHWASPSYLWSRRAPIPTLSALSETSQVAQDDPGLHFLLWGSLCDLPAWLSVHPPSPWLVESPFGDLENPLVQKDELCPRCHSVWTLPRLSCVASRRTLKPFFSRPLRQAFLFKLFEPLALSPKGIKLLLAALFDFYLLLFDLGLGPASYSTISGLYSSLSGYSFQAHSLDLQPLLRYKRSAPKQGMVGASNLNLLGVGAEKSSLYSCSSRSKKSVSGLSLLVLDPCKPSSDRSERAPQRASSQSSRLAPGSPSSLSVMFNSPAFLNKTFLGGLYKAFPCLGEKKTINSALIEGIAISSRFPWSAFHSRDVPSPLLVRA